jgi:hypothetical protein
MEHVWSPMTHHKGLLTFTFPLRSLLHAGRPRSIFVQYKTIVSKIYIKEKNIYFSEIVESLKMLEHFILILQFIHR